MHYSSLWRRPALASLAAAVVLALIAPLAAPVAALADDDASAAAPAGVARIDGLAGDVAIQRGDANDTLAAVANAPILGGDYMTTGPGARAEVGFDGRSAVRLGENVQIRFARIDPQNRDLQLAAGTIDVRLFGDADGQSTIETPSITIEPRSAGSYRVSVDANGETAVTVRSGHADIVTPQGTQPLDTGTTLLADGAAANPQLQSTAALAFDAFDGYNADQDRNYTVAQSQAPYVNTNIQGVADLSSAGNWVPDGSYGNVWIPANVAPDWAPYRDGSWVWEDGYGWTWVAAEPWGWAPYHYGRWYYSSAYRHWAWFPPAPGRFAPAWSPALVGFVGFNVGAVSVGFGNIGWVPLAPYEPFHPWWGGRGATTVVSVNATFGNTSIRYRNMQVGGAMTSVTRVNFQAGRFDHPYVASAVQLRTIQATPFQGPLPVVPSAANLRFTQHAPATALTVRASFLSQNFAGRATFATRTPFAMQQASVSRVTHEPYAPQAALPAQPSYARPAAVYPGASYAAPAAAPAARPVSNDPWSRFGARGPAAVPAAAVPSYGQSQATSSRPAAPAYTRPAAPSYGTPSYGSPSYGTPAYQRSAQPAYARPAQPAYGSQPAYGQRQAPAGFTRPAASGTTRPQARPSGDADRERDRSR